MPRKIDFETLDRKFPSVPRVQSKYVSRVPTVFCACGSVGSGKSVLVITVIQKMRQEGSLNRVFIISPTASSNQIYNAIATGENDWKIDLNSRTVFQDLKKIEEAIQADAEIYKKELEYVIVRNKFVNGDVISDAEERLLEERGYEDLKPKRPIPCIFVDDCQSSPLFSNNSRNAFTNYVLRCRHIGEGLGCSIFIAVQTSKGVPRSIRLNLTHVCVFRTHSSQEKKILYEELGAFVPEDEFQRYLDWYTLEPHSYLFIDLIEKRLRNSF